MNTRTSVREPSQARSRAALALVSTLVLVIAGLIAPATYAHAEGLTQYEGRDLLFHKHVDAAHIHEVDGELEVGLIEGYDTVRNADDVIVRLGPDANSDGDETSRIKVPDAPNLRFLGNPGDVRWNVPQVHNWDWSPVWPGIGAGKISDAFKPDSIKLHATSMEGPGDVEVYRLSYDGIEERYLSSTDPKYREIELEPNAHGHYNWMFTEAGRYTLKYQVTATKKDGTPYKSKEFSVRWFVGTDEQVGLPKGSWVPAHDIKNPVASLPGNEPTPSPSDDPTTEPSPTPSPMDSPSAPAMPAPSTPVDPGDTPTPTKPTEPTTPADTTAPSAPTDPAERLVLDKGHVDMFHVSEGRNGAPLLRLAEDVTGAHVTHTPEDVELHVKSAAKTTIPAQFPGAGEAYFLPETQDPNLVWPGWDTQAIAGTGLDERIDLRFLKVEGPGAIHLWGTKGLGEVSPLLEGGATELTSGAVRNQKRPAHTHANWAFSKPGVYRITVQAAGTRGGKETLSEPRVYTVTVGDEFRGAGSGVQEPSPKDQSDPAPGTGLHAPEQQSTTPGQSDEGTEKAPGAASSESADESATGSTGDGSTEADRSPSQVNVPASDGGQEPAASSGIAAMLPRTGFDAALIAGITLAVIAVGAGLVVIGKRARSRK